MSMSQLEHVNVHLTTAITFSIKCSE